MSRYFEKISYNNFSSSIFFDKDIYNTYKLPSRKTKGAAGYDFYAIEDVKIMPGEVKKIPTGVKAKFNDDEVLLLVVRSNYGFKYNVRMCNQVGVIDSDYYNNNDNEGHIWVCLQNHGEKDFVINKGDAFCQGIFVKYLVTDNEDRSFVKRSSEY